MFSAIEVPSSTIHHTCSESMNSDGLYPWELEWESQKLYKFEPWKKVMKQEEEFEDEEPSTDSILNDAIKREVLDKVETTETEDVIVEEEEEHGEENKEKELSVIDDDEEQEKAGEDKIRIGSETINFLTEKDLNEFDDSQEGETCLHIHTGDEEEKEDEENTKEEDDEEEEDEEEEDEERQESHLVTKFDSNNVTCASDTYTAEERHSLSSVPKVSCNNLSDSDSVEEKDGEDEKDSEQEEEELVICDGEVASSSLNNSPVNSDIITLASPSRASLLNCGENVLPSRFPEHLCDNLRLTSDASKPLNYATLDIPSNNLCKQVHSLPVKTLSDKMDKEKRRERMDKDKKKSDRTKVKERGKDREKEDRPPKKLKIKFKSEERAIVPPLRIRTEERGLKLTLKKQEGSGAYYSVGEERKREYRVEQNEDEEEEELGDIRPCEEEEEGNEDGEGHGSSLKEVKVVLQDVLKDKRFKKQVEEKSSKKRRKEKCEERNDKSEKNDRNDSSYNPNSHWINYSQPMHQNDGDKKFSQTINQDSRTWNCNPGEWRKSGGEGASNVDHSSDHKTRDYSSHLYSYSEHYGHEYSGRHNHSQPYGHSGSQQRNSHSYY